MRARIPLAAMGNALRVRDLLALPCVREHSLLGGEEGLDRRVAEVRLIHTGGPLTGLVADTLLVIPRAALEVESYQAEMMLREAHAQQARAILVAPPERSVPLSTPRLANKLALPLAVAQTPELFELAQQLALAVKQHAIGALETIDELLEVLAAGATTDEILAAASRALGAPVGLLSTDGTLIAGTGQPDAELLLAGDPVPRWQPDGRGGRIALPVRGGQDDPICWLLARLTTSQRELRTRADRVLRISAWALAGQLLARRSDAERDSRYRTELLAELLETRTGLDRRTADRAQVAGWRLDGWHTGVHLTLHPAPDPSLVLARRDRLTRALEAEGIGATVIERVDGYSLWTTTSEQPRAGSAELSAVRRALTVFLADGPPAQRLSAGVGRPHPGPEGISATLSEAREASLGAKPDQQGVGLMHFEGVGVKRLLFGWYTTEALTQLARDILEPIRAGSTNGELLDTLECYLDTESSLTDTAAALGIHRNTVTRRLRRIEELIGVSLHHPDERLALQLACRLSHRE
jgi:PucR family transcriptional regulator, purine catabolism regulatory protein